MPNPENIIQHKFPPNVSGNPNGRPKGARSTTTIRRELLQKFGGATNPLTGEQEILTYSEQIVYKQAKKAIEGDLGAARFIIEAENAQDDTDTTGNAPTAYTETLLDFIPRLNKRYVSPTHLMPLISALERIANGESVFLCISVPPRHGKTETLLNFIPYFLQRHSEKTVVYCSYAQQQSESKTRKAQGLIKEIGLSISNMANLAEFRLASGGGILTTGVGGGLTGQGADVLLIDDPIKNREEAESPVMRDKVWGWFEDVAETRLEPNSSVIVCMTRWHSDDLIGRILANRKEYEYIRLPALADGLSPDGKTEMPDILGRLLDAPLWPERYDFIKLDKIRREKAYTYAAMYQGLPTPRGAELFRDCTRYSELPKQGLRYAIGIDLAYTADRRADYTAIVVMARCGDIWYVVQAEHWQQEITYTKKRILEYVNQYGCKAVIEANGAQKAVYDELKTSLRGRLKVADVTGDKLSRSISLREHWNAGLVQVQDGRCQDFVQELQDFTGIKDIHDDYVDAAVYAFRELKTTGTNMYTL